MDEAEATATLGAERVEPMNKALARAKAKLETILNGSTGSVQIKIDWANAAPAGTDAATSSSRHYVQTPTVAKNKLKSRAEADDGETQAEIDLYNLLPTAGYTVKYATDTAFTVNFVSIPSALNKHLQFDPQVGTLDATIQFAHPNRPSFNWQFFKGNIKQGHSSFEATVVHETMHALGFGSHADLTGTPVSLLTWDIFRVAETATPLTTATFPTAVRELRPTVLSVWATQIGTNNGVYKASSGTRQGGDGRQAGHWRSLALLNPQEPIGAMDPGDTRIYTANGQKIYSRADVDALDLMGGL